MYKVGVKTNHRIKIVNKLVFCAQSTIKDYIRAKKNYVQSVSYLPCTQVIKPQIMSQNKVRGWKRASRVKSETRRI